MRPLKTSLRMDPAPSRWSYRVQRWWLTPSIRKILRFGLPSVLGLALIAAVFGDPGRRAEMSLAISDMRRQIETRPEFMVNLLAVEGASASIEAEIRELFPVDLPASSFDIDLEATREMIVDLPGVADASVRLRQGGLLVAEITERQPVAIWRLHAGLSLLDIEGVVLAPL
ncbi:MAG: cell division protein FtsQ, partial [Pseudomonadota bacterium]